MESMQTEVDRLRSQVAALQQAQGQGQTGGPPPYQGTVPAPPPYSIQGNNALPGYGDAGYGVDNRGFTYNMGKI